jgi:uncharacterized membrane protein (UPF0127 family)
MTAARALPALLLAAILAGCAARPEAQPATAPPATTAPSVTADPGAATAAPVQPATATPDTVVVAPVVIGPQASATAAAAAADATSPPPQAGAVATPAPSSVIAAPMVVGGGGDGTTPTTGDAEAPAALETPTPAGSVIMLPGVVGPVVEAEATVVPDGEVTLRIGDHTLRALVVATSETRARGLMFYRELPQDVGMLFVFPDDAVRSFWMRNTFVPLSIAFLDSDRRVLNIEDLQPLDETSRFSSGPARYALEVNQGWFASRGIGPGAAVEFELPAGLVVR